MRAWTGFTIKTRLGEGGNNEIRRAYPKPPSTQPLWEFPPIHLCVSVVICSCQNSAPAWWVIHASSPPHNLLSDRDINARCLFLYPSCLAVCLPMSAIICAKNVCLRILASAQDTCNNQDWPLDASKFIGPWTLHCTGFPWSTTDVARSCVPLCINGMASLTVDWDNLNKLPLNHVNG